MLNEDTLMDDIAPKVLTPNDQNHSFGTQLTFSIYTMGINQADSFVWTETLNLSKIYTGNNVEDQKQQGLCLFLAFSLVKGGLNPC